MNVNRTARRSSRRTFLAAGVGALALSAASYRRVLGANDRIGVGYIGYGLIGKRHVLDFQAQPDVEGVAVCDVHRGRMEEGRAELGGRARGYSDFRRLLENRDVDAVVVSTPDHWHALMLMMSCAAGKDVYVEKPLSLFVREGRWMTDSADYHRRVVQVGTQQRSGLHYQRARQLIRDGHIGQVMSVQSAAFRNVMPGFGTPDDCDPPPELDWNMMLGPAPLRPYNPNRGIYHFRWFWDYSGGQMTNFASHSLDTMYWCLGGEPTAVTSSGGRFCLTDNGETPDTQDASFEFTERNFTQGETQPTKSGPKNTTPAWTATWIHREASSGPGSYMPTTFFGTRGTLGINRNGFTVRADKKIPPQNHVPQFTGDPPVGGTKRVANVPEEYWTTPIEDKSGNHAEQFVRHVRNFLDCVKSRATPIADLASAHRVTTMCHLANLSLQLGRKLPWDAAKEDVINDAEASAQLVRPYRAPWDAELRAVQVSPASTQKGSS